MRLARNELPLHEPHQVLWMRSNIHLPLQKKRNLSSPKVNIDERKMDVVQEYVFTSV